MDNNAWKQKIERRRQRRRRERLFLLIVVAVLAAVGVWRYLYISSPEYALECAYEAVQNHDADTFAKYVDVDSVTSQAYDDLTRDMFAYDNNLSDSTKVMFETFYQKIKPQVVSGTAELIKATVVNGQWVAPVGDDILKGRQLGIDYEYLIHRSQLRNTEVLKINEVQKNDKSAQGTIEVRDVSTNTKYTLRISMVRNDDVWRVVHIVNYRDYLTLLEPIQNSELARYLESTKAIVDECNTSLSQCQWTFESLSSTGDGDFSDRQRNRLVDFVKSDILPVLEKRRAALDAVEAPPAAEYVHDLRKRSTNLSIDSWKAFIEGIGGRKPDEINRSKALSKEAMDLDYRIDDIIKHTSVAKAQQSVL